MWTSPIQYSDNTTGITLFRRLPRGTGPDNETIRILALRAFYPPEDGIPYPSDED